MIRRLLDALDRVHCARFGHEWRVMGWKNPTQRRAFCKRCTADRIINISITSVK